MESAKKDKHFLLIPKGKDEEDSGNAFLRNVQASPFPACVLATNGQLEEIVKPCMNPDNFSVLGIDTMYNIGKFYVTPTTYRHQMLKMIVYVPLCLDQFFFIKGKQALRLQIYI